MSPKMLAMDDATLLSLCANWNPFYSSRFAAGNGNASLAAARRFCKIVSTDYVQSLLDQSKLRSEVEGLSVDYRPADAENLPFTDNCFDNVMSTFGVLHQQI